MQIIFSNVKKIMLNPFFAEQVALNKIYKTLFLIYIYFQPENIICETKKSTSIKLIDFGLACKLDPTVPVRVSRATAEFAAPEIANNSPVGFYTDMWSVGVLAYVL